MSWGWRGGGGGGGGGGWRGGGRGGYGGGYEAYYGTSYGHSGNPSSYGGGGLSKSQMRKREKQETRRKRREKKQDKIRTVEVEPGTKLMVRLLPEFTSAEDLETAFEQFGEVTYVDKAKDHLAYVFFSDKESAKRAVDGMDGRDFFGANINVQVCRGNTMIMSSYPAKVFQPTISPYTQGLVKHIEEAKKKGMPLDLGDDDDDDSGDDEPPAKVTKMQPTQPVGSLVPPQVDKPDDHGNHEDGCLLVLKCDYCPYASFTDQDMRGHLEDTYHYAASIYAACPDDDTFTYKKLKKILAVKSDKNMNTVRLVICPECKLIFRDIFSCALHHQFYHDDEGMGKYAISTVEDETTYAYHPGKCPSCSFSGSEHLQLTAHWENSPRCHPFGKADVPEGTTPLYMCQICVTVPFYDVPEALRHVCTSHLKQKTTKYTQDEASLRVVYARTSRLIPQAPPLPLESDRPVLVKQWCTLVEQMMIDKKNQRMKKAFNLPNKKLVQLRNMMRKAAAVCN